MACRLSEEYLRVDIGVVGSKTKARSMIAPRLQRTNTGKEERNRTDYLLLAEKRTLEMIAGGASLA